MFPRHVKKPNPAMKKVIQPQNAYIQDQLFQTVLVNEISKFLSSKDQIILSKTCTRLHNLFQPNYNEIVFKQLLQSIVDDDRETTKRILDEQPALLFYQPKKALIIQSQKTWQIFHITEKPFELVTKRKQLEMAKLIRPYFNAFQNGKAEVLAQWKVREASDQEKNQYVLKIKTLIAVIAKENFPKATEDDKLIGKISEETKKALEAFRKELLPDVAITLDDYVDIEQFLIAAYRAYDENFSVFLNEEQRKLFCICVIGFIQSLVIPEKAMLLCHGLYSQVCETSNVSEQAKSLLVDAHTPFYRSSSNSHSGLGFEHLVGWEGGKCVDALWPTGSGEEYMGHECLLSQAKTTEFEKLKSEVEIKDKPKKERCMIQ